MNHDFPIAKFNTIYDDDDICLEEIKRLKFAGGVFCEKCRRVTRHYKLKKRKIYACKFCRSQVSPLKGTIFEKSTTPLRLWFYALFLMTQARADISARLLQKELGVTYKTAWRIYKRIRFLMEKNNGDLLSNEQVRRWVFFNKIELRVVRKNSF